MQKREGGRERETAIKIVPKFFLLRLRSVGNEFGRASLESLPIPLSPSLPPLVFIPPRSLAQQEAMEERKKLPMKYVYVSSEGWGRWEMKKQRWRSTDRRNRWIARWSKRRRRNERRLLSKRLECSCFPALSVPADPSSRSRHESLLASDGQKATARSESSRDAPSFPLLFSPSTLSPVETKSLEKKTNPGSSRAASSPGWARASRPPRSACCSRRAGTG